MKKIYKIKIREKIFETKEACSFVLDIPEDYKKDFLFQPGQFLTLYLSLKGKKMKRSYSISSSPLVEESFKITVKKIKNGRASTHLVDHVKEDEILETSKPLGNFFKKSKDFKPKESILFAAGSGITPIFSILKSLLLLDSKNKVTLIYSNKKEEDIIYREEITKWCKNYPDQLKVIHCLSRDNFSQKLKTEKNIFQEFQNIKCHPRLNESFLKTFLNGIKSSSSFKGVASYYLCGPIKYMKWIQNILIQNEVSKSEIFKEIFSSPLEISQEIPSKAPPEASLENTSEASLKEKEDKVFIGDPIQKLEKPQKIEVLLNEQKFLIPYDGSDNIVQALINEGYEPPYSCLEGNCMTCLGKILEGTVYQDHEGVLDEENISSQEALTCQAKGASQFIKVSYDDID